VQLFGCDVAVASFEKEAGEGKALTRRPQACCPQTRQNPGRGLQAFHASYIGDLRRNREKKMTVG
jgi:hypothetical protein